MRRNGNLPQKVHISLKPSNLFELLGKTGEISPLRPLRIGLGDDLEWTGSSVWPLPNTEDEYQVTCFYTEVHLEGVKFLKVKKGLSFWDGLFSGAMLVSGRVCSVFPRAHFKKKKRACPANMEGKKRIFPNFWGKRNYMVFQPSIFRCEKC